MGQGFRIVWGRVRLRFTLEAVNAVDNVVIITKAVIVDGGHGREEGMVTISVVRSLIGHVSWLDLCAVSFVIKWRVESGDVVR
jgi:hypothetical protein